MKKLTTLLLAALSFSLTTAGAASLVPATASLLESTAQTGNDTELGVGLLLRSIDLNHDFTVGLTQVKLDQGTSGSQGALTVDVESDGQSGMWNYTGIDYVYAFVVNGGNFYKAYYLLDGEGNIAAVPTSAGGDDYFEYAWDMLGITVGSGNTPELSHASVYTAPGKVRVVPEPASLALTGGFLGGLVLLRRRSKQRSS